MAAFEALHEWGCRSSIKWFEAGNVKLLGIDLVREGQEKVRASRPRCCQLRVDKRSMETIRKRHDCHSPSLHPGRDMHSRTIVNPKRTLGLTYLLNGRRYAL